MCRHTQCSLLVLCLLSLNIGAFGQNQYISMPSDPYIPNVAYSTYADHLIESIQNGHWSDPNTWGGILPSDSHTVVVLHEVIYDDVDTEVFDLVVNDGGRLIFQDDLTTTLTVGTIEVLAGGVLQVGTVDAPIQDAHQVEIIFADRPIDLVKDPGQYTQGLIVFGELIMHGADKGNSFERLSAEAFSGQNVISIGQSNDQWKVGDRIKIPDSRQLASSFNDDTRLWEERIISVIAPDHMQFTLDAPLTYDHKGAHDKDGLRFLPHAMNMSRNIILKSENPNGSRGHTLFAQRANIDVRYVSFENLGRTLNDDLDNTEWDENGNVSHVGTNQASRYPIHTHHLFGPAVIPLNGYQYTLIGNVVDGGESDHQLKWGITIHGSHYGLIENNVVYNYQGSGIVTEDGSESFNVFDGNMVMRVRGEGGLDVHDRGEAGSGLWFRGPNNYYRNNVATNTEAAAFSMNAYRLGNEDRMIPAFQGAMTMQNGVPLDPDKLPILEFSNNEGYGIIQIGFDIWEVGGIGNAIEDVPETAIDDFRLWHVSRRGVHIYRSHRLTFDRYVNIGDSNRVTRYMQVSGFNNDHQYPTRQIIIRNSDIQNLAYGITSPPSNMIPNLIKEANMGALDSAEIAFISQGQPGVFLVENTYLKNWHNVIVTNPRHLESKGPRKTILRNVLFAAGHGSNRRNPQWDINMSQASSYASLTTLDQVVVENYNNQPGLNFNVFYKEQHPDSLLPETGSGLHIFGAPLSGLTNQEAANEYCIAFAGAIAPCADEVTYPRINGFTCDVSASGSLIVNDTSSMIICSGDSVFINNAWRYASDTFFEIIHSPQGCPVRKWTQLKVLDNCQWPGGGVVFVDQNAVGLNDGSDWTNAFNKLSDAISASKHFNDIEEIWVAEGAYLTSMSGDRMEAFELANDLKWYGGFLGTESEKSERLPNVHSILEGDLGQKNDYADNSFHIVRIDESCSDCMIDGFIIQSGNANGPNVSDKSGAGIYSNGAAIISNSKIRFNQADAGGEGVYLAGPFSQLIFENVIVE